MKSNGFVSKLIIGSVLVSAFSCDIVNGAELMTEQYFQQIFHMQEPNRAFGAPDRSIPSNRYSYYNRPRYNINQPRRTN